MRRTIRFLVEVEQTVELDDATQIFHDEYDPDDHTIEEVAAKMRAHASSPRELVEKWALWPYSEDPQGLRCDFDVVEFTVDGTDPWSRA